MLNNKLIKTIQLLSNKELEGFAHYIHCPLYNKDVKIIHLFELLKNYYPAFDQSTFDLGVLFKKIYPQKNKYDSSLRSLMSRMTKLIEDFVANMLFQKNEKEQQRLTLTFLNEREPDGDRIIKAIQQIQKKGEQSIQQFTNQIQLSNLYFENFTGNNSVKLEKSLKNMISKIDVYYIYLKLKFAIESNYQHSKTPVDENSKIDFENVLNAVNQLSESEYPLVRAYFYAYHLTHQDKQIQADNAVLLQKILEQKPIGIPQGDMSQLYLILVNFYIEHTHNGIKNYTDELFYCYQNMLEANLLRFKILPNHFKNIVILALDMGEIKWTKYFIKKYHNDLLPKEKKNILNFCLASLAFELKNYPKAIRKLVVQHRFSSAYYEVKRKILEVKTAHQLGDEELLIKMVTKLRVYLYRETRLTNYQLKQFKNFELAMRKVISIRSTLGVKRLRQKIQQVRPLAEKNWLLQKTNELDLKFRKVAEVNN